MARAPKTQIVTRSSSLLSSLLAYQGDLTEAWSDVEAGFESFEADRDAFGLSVFMDGFSSVLATDSAHFVAAERNHRVTEAKPAAVITTDPAYLGSGLQSSANGPSTRRRPGPARRVRD
jgi:hypothetical protein